MTTKKDWEEEFNKEFLSDPVKLVNANGQEFMTLPNAKAKDILAFIHKVEAEAERRGVEKCIEEIRSLNLDKKSFAFEQHNRLIQWLYWQLLATDEEREIQKKEQEHSKKIMDSIFNTPPND